MNIKVQPKIHNRFDIFKKNVATGEEKQVGYAENIVLNAIWARLCSGSTYFVNIHYGTGTGTLDPARTSLFTHLGTGGASTVETVRATPTSHWRRSITLGLTTANGSELTEVGIAYGATASNLVTHAQIRDMNGNVISILKTDVDIITIYATVYITMISDDPYIKLIKHENNALLSYLLGGSFPDASFVFDQAVSSNITDYCDGVRTNLASITGSWANDVVNKKRTISTTRLNTDVGNGHISGISIAGTGRLHLPAFGTYSGLELANVPLGVGDGETINFSVPSRNVDLSTLAVKVDGVPTDVAEIESYSGETIRYIYRVNSSTTSGNVFGDHHRAKNGNNVLLYAYHAAIGASMLILKSESKELIRTIRTTLTPDYLGRSATAANVQLLRGAINADASVHIWKFNDENDIHIDGAPALGLSLSGSPVSNSRRPIDINADGDVLALIQGDAPYLRVFDLTGGAWVERTNVTIPSGAVNVVMADNGNKFFVSYGNTGVYVCDWNGSSWTITSFNTTANIRVFNSSANGDTLIFDGYGKVEVYHFANDVWSKEFDITPSYDPSYSSRVGISDDGQIICFVNIAGAQPSQVYDKLYCKTDSEWIQCFSASHTIPVLNNVGNAEWANDVFIYTGHGIYNSNGELIINGLEHSKNVVAVEFATAPALGAVITADYTVNGIHKTDQRVIDISGEIQFGEPTP